MIQKSLRTFTVAVILAMTAIGAWAILTGQVAYVITDGVSMNPLYQQGDLVFVVKDDSYHVREIAAYHDPGSGSRVLHRIISGDGVTGFAFKGDNNESIDPFKPTADQLIGRAVLHVPKGGLWLSPLLGPSGLGVLGFLFVSGTAVKRTRREIPRGRRKKRVKAMSRQGGSWATAVMVAKTVERLPPLLRTAAALVAVLTGLGIALGILGWMKPVVDVRTNHVAAATQSMIFSYSATVPLSAAYDGTTVLSPEPIFRKLADHVALRLQYQGHPGTMVVTATISDGTGWHSTMMIAPWKKFFGKTYDTTVNLDLGVFERRAKDAAMAVGSQVGSVNVAFTARVTAPSQQAFTAPLSFSLAPLAFTLTGGATSLTVGGTAPAATAAFVPREITALGRTIMTAAQARSYAVLMFLGSLVGAVAIAFVTRRDTPLRTRAEIERRHPQLLVHVEPMTSAPGKPVVTVDDFAALAKLAERYGQMVLTWSRPDADDFVVRDDGITYRYRIPIEAGPDVTAELVDVDAPVRGRRGKRAADEERPASHRYP